jgi:transketolase
MTRHKKRASSVSKKKRVPQKAKRQLRDAVDMRALRECIAQVRADIIRSTTAAGSGHPSSSLSAADIVGTLFFGHLFRADLSDTAHPANDRFICSKGHAAPLLYAVYAALGMVTEDELRTLREFNSRLEGHPTMRFPFTEVPTGSLGQGLGVGVGMAIHAQYVSKAPYRTFVLLGDSELMEGSNWEAVALAAHYTLSGLVALVDVNRLGQRGETMHGYDMSAYQKKFTAFGWQVITVDGHSIPALLKAYQQACSGKKKQPTVILAKTVKGKGVPFIENKHGWHGKALSHSEAQIALKHIAAPVKRVFATLRKPAAYTVRSARIRPAQELDTAGYGSVFATRKAYGHSLVEQFPVHPAMVVLDAEVSNSTHSALFAKRYPSRFFEMFIGEQAMVSVALGMAARGALPCVSTFAAFFTRAFDQLRMAALSGKFLLCAGSHAGVSIGEDGASQMGLEDIALFRSLPGARVLYPCDHVSEEKLAALALAHPEGITYIRTTRADTPPVYAETVALRIGGSQVVRKSSQDVCTIVAAGVTLIEALAAYERLKKDGVAVRVLDLYSLAPLDVAGLKDAYRDTGMLIVVEDHYAAGGMGEAVAAALPGARMVSLCVRIIPRSGKPHELLAFAGIDRDAICAAVHNHTV